MKPPVHRVGQTVQVPSVLFTEVKTDAFFTDCQILYANEDGTYFVRHNKTSGFAVINETDISTYPETDFAKPRQRNQIRIVFFGNGKFALPTLKMLVDKGYDVAAVVTMEDKPCGRSNKMTSSPVKVLADSLGILVYQPRKLNANRFLRHILSLHATLGVVVDFKVLPPSLFRIPKWGTINLHSSLLPMYRGASTITSAIQDGNAMTGVTTFLLDEKIDTGKIINNLGVAIGSNDTAEDVHRKLGEAGAVMVDDAIQRIAHSCRPVSQSDLICTFIQPSHAPKLYRKDCYIPWHLNADTVHNFIRARSSLSTTDRKSPVQEIVPTAWLDVEMLDTNKVLTIKIHRASKTNKPRGFRAPGEMFWENRKLYLTCSDELLSVDVLQLPGKRRMTAIEFHNGYKRACKGFCKPKTR